MRRSDIDRENRALLDRQRQFRDAADVVTDAWMAFPVVRAIAVIGSVARPLWKEVPRFREYRSRGIELWHECGDLDLAVWLDSLGDLDALRRACARALREMFEAGASFGIVGHQVDTFLFEPGSQSRTSVLLQSMSEGQAGLPGPRLRRHSVQQGDRWLRPR